MGSAAHWFMQDARLDLPATDHGCEPAVWFPAIRTGTGTDVFTERLATELGKCGLRAEIAWLPLRAEYAPWTVAVPEPPDWANVVHVNTWLHPRFLPRHLPVVATLHHAVHCQELEPYKGRLRSQYHRLWIRSVERRTLRRADVLVAVSEFAAETARQTFLGRSMQVIYNGVDTEYFRPSAQRVSRQPFRLLFVGKWAPLKGVKLLAPIMRELGDRFELYYTGGMAAECDKPDMPNNMRDIGRLHGADAVIAAMQNADALLFPSSSEGFGLVAAEAMACGLPVIATRGSSLTEVVEDGITGILCPQDDIASFAAAARWLASYPDRVIRMSLDARAACMRRFEIKGMIQAYLDVYRGVLMQEHRSP